MTNRLVFTLSMILAIYSSCYSQHDWVLRKQKDGISVYSLKEENSKFNAIKVEAVLKGSVKNLVEVLLDVEGHKEWAFDTKAVELLKAISEQELIYYKQIQSPPTVANRDLVLHLKLIESADGKSVSVESYSVPDHIPPKKGYVRVPISNEKWKVNELTNGTIKIDYHLEIDPGGSLSPGVVNLFSAKGPYESFEKLRSILIEKSK